MNFELKKLDEDWILNFEKIDKLYEDFYTDNLYYINIQFIYINKENEIEKIKEEKFLMSEPNKILREEIVGLIKRNIIDNDIKYSLQSILRYNINLEPTDIKHFLTNDIEVFNYLFQVRHIDTIVFDKTINMFQDLNDIFVIFCEKTQDEKQNHNTTKKVYLKLNNNHKRTIRKQYKD